MVLPTLAPLIILKTMNTNKAIIGLIACLLLFAIIPVECEAVQFKSRLMKKKEADGTKYLKSAIELQLHIDDLASVFAGIIEQAADQVIAASKNFICRHAKFTDPSNSANSRSVPHKVGNL
jgi:hypothetical protein